MNSFKVRHYLHKTKEGEEKVGEGEQGEKQSQEGYGKMTMAALLSP